ncbi:unnamed protein product [Alopecurus aequalis]
MIVSEHGGLWRIKTLNLNHNHTLDPHSRGGADQLPYNKKKVSNYGTTINRERKNSEMMEVLAFFSKKRSEDPGFYYSFQIDQNSKVHIILWADAKSRSYYETCGDCISFDTTFLTNKYNLPFAPIVGVTPHGHTYIFACALIGNERATSFKWVFKEFVAAMGGKHPQTIITDQDRAMRQAIESELPNTIHKSCLFRIKSKAEDNLGSTFRANEGLYEEFQDIIDNSLTEQEFEMSWQKMIEDYKKIPRDVTRLQINEKTRGETYLVFQAKNYPIKEHKNKEYVVHVDLAKEEYSCICCKFDKDGLLCSHILKVMLHLDIAEIPEKYFIDRWRKQYKRILPNMQQQKNADSDAPRYNVLSRKLVPTVSKASKSKRKYEYFLKEIDRVDEALSKMDSETEGVEEQDNSITTITNFATTSNDGSMNSIVELLDPDVANTKGRPRTMTIREAIKANKFYKCGHCGRAKHTKRNCPNLHLVYNLPKSKKPRKNNKTSGGQWYLYFMQCH